jgi:hypothetical protein
MPWLPPGKPHTLLAGIPASSWNAWADGERVGPPPHTIRATVYGCVLNRDFSDPSENPPIQYKKGMQGQLLEESASNANPPRMLAKVFIRGITEGPGFTNRWVPLEYVTKDKPWQTRIDKWELQLRLVGGTFNSHNWTSNPLPDTTLLGTTITRLITAFRQSPPGFLGGKLSEFIDKYNITAISNAILQGIKQAGLYQDMKDGNFDIQSMMNKATTRIHSGNVSHAGGVYVRFHVSSANVPNWRPNTKYLSMLAKPMTFQCVSIATHIPGTPTAI